MVSIQRLVYNALVVLYDLCNKIFFCRHRRGENPVFLINCVCVCVCVFAHFHYGFVVVCVCAHFVCLYI